MITRNLLVVEDDISNIRGTVALLENRNVHVDIVGTVQGAKEALSKNKYDLLLIDWTLPLIPDGPDDSEGGAKLLKFIDSKKESTKNFGVKHFIITKQTDQFSDLPRIQGSRLGIISKLDALSIVESVSNYFSDQMEDV